MSDAVESSAASPSVRPAPPGPVRTCVGCRERAAAADLLRVVVEAAGPGQPGRFRLDPRRNAPGRGAWLHPDPRCAELAERRRAFARALRVPVDTDASAVVALVGTADLRRVGTGADPSGAGDTVPRDSARVIVPGTDPGTHAGDHEGEKKQR